MAVRRFFTQLAVAGLCLRLGRGAHRLACDPLPCSPSSVAGAAASGSELENLATLTLVMQLLYHQGQIGKNLQNRKNTPTIQFFEIGKFPNSESLNFGAVFSIWEVFTTLTLVMQLLYQQGQIGQIFQL